MRIAFWRFAGRTDNRLMFLHSVREVIWRFASPDGSRLEFTEFKEASGQPDWEETAEVTPELGRVGWDYLNFFHPDGTTSTVEQSPLGIAMESPGWGIIKVSPDLAVALERGAFIYLVHPVEHHFREELRLYVLE